ADPIDHTQCQHRLGGIIEQRALERSITPGLGDDTRADMWSNLGLVRLDNGVQRRRIDIAFFREHGLKRPDSQLHFRELRAVLVMIMMMFVFLLHGRPIPFPESY